MGGQQLVPYVADGRDYRCRGCGEKIGEGAIVDHGERDGSITWVKVSNADGDVLHECGQVADG